MPEELLDRTQVAAVLQHMGRVGVAQRVRARGGQAHEAQAAAERAAHGRRLQAAAAARQQQRIAAVRVAASAGRPSGEPGGHGLEGRPADGDEAHALALAVHAHLARRDVAAVERAGLGGAQPAAVEELEQRVVAQVERLVAPATRRAGGRRRARGPRVGSRRGRRGPGRSAAGSVSRHARVGQAPVQGAHRREGPRAGRRREAAGAEARRVGAQVGARGVLRPQVARARATRCRRRRSAR